MSKLFEAVENKNVPEVEEILKQCTPELLEYRGGWVIKYFFFYFTSLFVSSTIYKSEILLFLDCVIYVLIPFTTFQFVKVVYYFVYLWFCDAVKKYLIIDAADYDLREIQLVLLLAYSIFFKKYSSYYFIMKYPTINVFERIS